jgi:hypothetical protein
MEKTSTGKGHLGRIPGGNAKGVMQMTYADSAERAAFISGLRELARYLESNPEVPAPGYSSVFFFPPDDDWAQMCAAIDAVAAPLGVPAGCTSGGHYIAVRAFGPVEYRAVAIPPRDDSSSEGR